MGGLLWWIAGGVAVSIPVIIHLLHRQRTQPIKWGAMQFLLESPLQQRRRKKVDHWLLMLLRMALLALLVVLLARPLMVDGKYNPLASNVATDIGVVIDHTLSTGRHSGDSTVYDRSVATLAKLTEPGVLKPGDTYAITCGEPNATSGRRLLLSPPR